MKKVLIINSNLHQPTVRVDVAESAPKARVRLCKGVELCLEFDEFREWLGAVGLELGQAEADLLAGYSNQPNMSQVSA